MPTNSETSQVALSAYRKWYAVHTRHQHESLANEILIAKGFETFFPTFPRIHVWKDRRKQIQEALFPGYLFLADVDDRRNHVLTTPGVCSIVCSAGRPAEIATQEVEAIRCAVSGPFAVEPHAYLQEGDRVKVSFGPLAGIEGILVRKGTSAKLVLCIEMLGRAAGVEIDSACVEPLIQTIPAYRIRPISTKPAQS